MNSLGLLLLQVPKAVFWCIIAVGTGIADIGASTYRAATGERTECGAPASMDDNQPAKSCEPTQELSQR